MLLNLAEHLRTEKGQHSIGIPCATHWNRVLRENSEKAEEIMRPANQSIIEQSISLNSLCLYA